MTPNSSTTPNIILTGFMGTGKTSVGRYLAERLNRPFVDLDERIVARAGKSIPAIFAEDGEAAFRELEAAACLELAEPQGVVAATGGGAAVNPANRAALSRGGLLICLDAHLEALLVRLEGYSGRPMLDGGDLRERVKVLLAQRADAYAAITHHVDTTGHSVAAAAGRVLALLAGLPEEGQRLLVRADTGGYDILIAEGLLAQAGQRLQEAGLPAGRCAVVTNPAIGAHHASMLVASLTEWGYEPHLFEVPEGEAYKTLDTAAHLYGRFAAARLARNEPVIALGGGVIGDLAGFVAATWLRGVPFVQAPTSLLAMVDASVGGKVAVDLPQGKNLVGAFKQPELVLIDPEVLSTLPAAEFRAGLAETVKAGIIGDPALYEQMASWGPATLTTMIADAVRVKTAIVERDPFEHGDRAWLNLGHTFGHALERISGYTLRHGEAVSIGMVAAAELSADLGLCPPALPGDVRSVLERLGLPVSHAFDPAAAYAAMDTDKKRRGRSLRFVVIEQIGQVRLVEDVPESAVLQALASIQARPGEEATA